MPEILFHFSGEGCHVDVDKVEMLLNDPLEIPAVRRGVLHGDPQMLAQQVCRTALHFAAVREDDGREVHAGPLLLRDRDAVLRAVFHLILHGVEDRPGGVLPGGGIQGDVHAGHDVGEAVHLEVHGRPSDDGCAVVPADNVDIRRCGVDLACDPRPPEMRFRPSGFPAAFELVGAFSSSLLSTSSKYPGSSCAGTGTAGGGHFVRIHRRNAVPVFVLDGIEVTDHPDICFSRESFFFSQVVL